MPFTQVFSGSVIYPSDTTYLSLSLTADVSLSWPIEQQVGGSNIVADIIDVATSTPGLSVTLPDATVATSGFTALFNNVGAQTVTIKDSTGGTIVSLASGTAWQIYLRDNSTAAGLWRTFQYGASVSVTNAAALAGAGLVAITTSLNAQITINSQSTNYALVDADRAKAVIWTSGVGDFTLPNPTAVGANWFSIIRNSGSGALTVTPVAGTIDGAASKSFQPGDSGWVVTDGTDYYTLGFGSSSGSSGGGFDHTSINVAGSGNYTLTGTELNRVSYYFTGALTGNRNVLVPTTVQEYWVTNNTSGAFTLTVKTAAGTGITVGSGQAAILQCDGTNVTIAQSTGTSFPITVGQGGTGATTAAGARTNLGSTAVGDALFTTASAAAARSTIGAPSSATTITGSNGVSGGGDLSANRVLSLDITGLTVDASPDSTADYVATYDASAGTNKKVLLSNLNTSVTYKSKAADTARSSTAVAAADPDLTTTLSTGIYEIEVFLGMSTSGSGGARLQFNFTGTLDTPTQVVMVQQNNGGSWSGYTQNGIAINGTVTETIGGVDETIHGRTSLNVTAGGTFAVYWAQNTSDAAATTMRAGSSMRITKVA